MRCDPGASVALPKLSLLGREIWKSQKTLVPSKVAERDMMIEILDDGDYVLAQDFEVDVPEFVHDPSWFRPSGEGAGSDRAMKRTGFARRLSAGTV